MRIVLTSVLKPVTDPRLLARLGRTLAELPGAEVYILAHTAADCPAPRPDTERANVFLRPVFSFPRLSAGRARAGLTLLRHLRAIKPDILVIGAAELLPAGLWWQRRTGGRLVYDVRENYALNVRTQQVFPAAVAGPLAGLIAAAEAAAAPQLAGVLLAERVYAEQLPWLKDCRRVEVIENKYQPTTPILPAPRATLTPDRPARLLLSGTLSDLYGTFDAIEAVRGLREVISSDVELWVVGHAPQAAAATRLRALAAEHPWLRLTGIEAPVPHAVIIEAVRRADIGLLPYRPHPSLAGCVPTKLWEYLGEGLPLVCFQDMLPSPPYEVRGDFFAYSHLPRASGGYSDFSKAIHHVIYTHSRFPYNPPLPPPPEAFWATEAPRLLAFFRALSAP